MLLIIGIGLVSGVFIGRNLLSKKVNKDKISKTTTNFLQNLRSKSLTCTSMLINTIDKIPYIVLKRIHSITGIVFIGGFVITHFINNTIAYNPKKLNELSKSIHKNPLFPIVEILGIYIPLTTHIIIGLILLQKGKFNPQLKTETNYRYFLQRLSAYIILKTLLFHLITIRFNEYLPDSFRKLFNIPDKRDLTYQKVHVWFNGPLSPIGYITYLLFVSSISYHLSNGIWTAAITWGLTKTYEKQKKLRNLSNIIFIILLIWGKIIIKLYSKPYNEQDNQEEN